MFHSKRMYAGVLLLACATAAQAIGHNGSADLKRDMARIVLDGHLPALSPAAFAQAIDRASEVYSFTVDSLTPEPRIEIQTHGRVSGVDVFPNAEGTVLTIQLYDAIVIPAPGRSVLDGGYLVGGLTAYLAQVEPQFVSRLEVQLLAPATASAQINDDSVTITLAPAAHGAAAAAGPSDESFRLATLEFQRRLSATMRAKIDELGLQLANASQSIQDHEIFAIATSLERVGLADHQHGGTQLNNAQRANCAEIMSAYRNIASRFAGTMGADSPAQIDDADTTGLDALYSSYREIFATLTSESAGVEKKINELVAGLSQVASDQPPLADLNTQLARLAQDDPDIEAVSPVRALDEALSAMRIGIADRGVNAAVADNTQDQVFEPRAAKAPDSAYREYFSAVLPDQEALRRAQEAGIIVLAQAETPAPATDPAPAEAEDLQPAEAEDGSETEGRRTLSISGERTSIRPKYTLYDSNLSASEDPLQQPVNIDFREMPLANVVNLLATKAGINVIAGTEVSGTVTANLQNIPLGQAIEIVLRQNGLGIIEEFGIYRITTYEEAIASRRDTRVIYLKNAQAVEVQATLQQIVQTGASGQSLSVTSNETANIVILSGPSELVQQFEVVVEELDFAKPVIPTRTETIELNYSTPDELLQVITPLLSDSGKVSGDLRSNILVVTDIPLKVEEVQRVVAEIDVPVKQVSISTMIVDAKLSDDAQTGIDWTLNAIRHTNARGQIIGDLDNFTSTNDFTTGPPRAGIGINPLPVVAPSTFIQPLNLGAQVAFGLISGDIDIDAVIGAQVQADNADLLANPTIITVENKPARISIAEEIPYQELSQSTTGPPIATTEFKEVGTILEVTPQVTHDDHVIVDLMAKQSDTKGESVTGVPPEDKREATTTLRVKNGQTIFIGGLRRFDDETSTRKTPVLGDIPVFGLLFKKQSVVKAKVELLIFMTANILPDEIPELTPDQQRHFDRLNGLPGNVDATKQLWQNIIRPQDQRDPFWKWERAK